MKCIAQVYPHPFLQSSIYLWKTITQLLHQVSFTYRTMHTYLAHIFQMKCMAQVYPHPLLQLSIYLWKTITPSKFHIYNNAHIPSSHSQMKCMAQVYPPPPIEHRCMENHYTESLGHPDIKFYPLPTNIYADEFPSDRKYYLFDVS